TGAGGAISVHGPGVPPPEDEFTPFPLILRVASSTLSGNRGGTGDSIYNSGSGVQIENTILNVRTAGTNIYNTATGAVASLGFNLSSDNGSGFLTGTNDQINTPPLLGPLQDNGGPTLTHAPLCGSPAIDKGRNTSFLGTDQRGAPRTV